MNLFTHRVLAHHAGAQEGKRRSGAGEVDQDVIGRPAGASGLAADVGQLLWLRVNINQFYLVNDPVASSQETTMTLYVFGFHAGQAAVSL